MRIFRAFGKRDMQRVLLILDMAEGEGVDPQLLKHRLHSFINEDYKKRTRARIRGRVAQRKVRQTCPECGEAPLRLVLGEDGMVLEESGVRFVGCRKCRYSRPEVV